MSVVSLSKDARARALCSKVCHNNGLMIQILPVINMYQTRHSLTKLLTKRKILNPLIVYFSLLIYPRRCDNAPSGHWTRVSAWPLPAWLQGAGAAVTETISHLGWNKHSVSSAILFLHLSCLVTGDITPGIIVTPHPDVTNPVSEGTEEVRK